MIGRVTDQNDSERLTTGCRGSELRACSRCYRTGNFLDTEDHFELCTLCCLQFFKILFRAPALLTSKKSLILACASVTKNAAMATRAKEWQEVVQSMSSLQLTCVFVQT